MVSILQVYRTLFIVNWQEMVKIKPHQYIQYHNQAVRIKACIANCDSPVSEIGTMFSSKEKTLQESIIDILIKNLVKIKYKPIPKFEKGGFIQEIGEEIVMTQTEGIKSLI